MNAVSLIRKKRDGASLTREELQSLVTDYVNDEIPDYQMSAFLMAVYFKGMTAEESTAFTDIMLHSGEIIDLSAIPGIKVDKHSTGGVGDKVSLILAPTVAACGVPVPMISGRGLGHTGGTLDKLESIPGFRTELSVEEFRRAVADVGVVLAGQTNRIAPADRKMYALRDVTATIESLPLIAGSIMSKKLAEGIDALVLDVKVGNGAFMRTEEEALVLAQALVRIGNQSGKRAVGFVTDMNQPLGYAVGNWLEVKEAIECLRGKNVPDLMEVTYVLGGAMVFLGGKGGSIEEGMKACHSAIWSGRAYEKFLQLTEYQGGDSSVLRQPDSYPPPRYRVDVPSSQGGFVQDIDTRAVGLVATALGAGRSKVEDAVDPKAGIVLTKKLGDAVRSGEPIAVLHTDREEAVEWGVNKLTAAIRLGSQKVAPRSPVIAFVDESGTKPWTTPLLY
jgi:pyrimidine-nucleoside phosphorylase